MTAPNIDTILSAISAPPGSGPTRSPPPPELFREHLQLQPYDPAAPAGNPPAATQDSGVLPSDDKQAADAATEHRDDDSTADADGLASTGSECVAVDCGAATAQPPPSDNDGEAPADAADAESQESIQTTGDKLQPRGEGQRDKLPAVGEAVADQPASPEPAADDAEEIVQPAAAKNVIQPTTAAAVASEQSATSEQETAVVVSGEAAVGEGEVKSELPTVTVSTAKADKQPAKRPATAKGNVQAEEDSGQRATGVQSTAHSDASPAAGPDDSAGDDGRKHRGREKATDPRESASPQTDTPADRPPSADTRAAAAKPLPSVEPPPVAGEQNSPAAPPPAESSSSSAATPQPTSVPTAAAPGERLAAALGHAQSAERPSRTALTEAQQARLVQRVAKAFDVAQGRGETTIRLRLSPPQLGSLRLEVQMESGALTARLEVETHSAREALVDNLHALRQRLADHNIRIENFDVSLTDRQSGGAAGRGGDSSAPQDGGRQRPAPQQRTTSSSERGGGEGKAAPRNALLDDSNIDILV